MPCDFQLIKAQLKTLCQEDFHRNYYGEAKISAGYFNGYAFYVCVVCGE